MAIGEEFPEANLMLGPPTPEDGAAGTVYALPVHRYRDLDGNPHVISRWRLSREELEEVLRTGVVWFHCWGQTHPPISISGHTPFVAAPSEQHRPAA